MNECVRKRYKLHDSILLEFYLKKKNKIAGDKFRYCVESKQSPK